MKFWVCMKFGVCMKSERFLHHVPSDGVSHVDQAVVEGSK